MFYLDRMALKLIKLNIGGYKFCTTIETLTKYPDCFFTSLLSEKLPTTKDEEGAYFIDRDGQFFSPILTWLRTNEISIPQNSMTKEDVIREARYYTLQPLVDELTESANPANHMDDEASVNQEGKALACPSEIEKHVYGYWERHQQTILSILEKINKEGQLSISVQIIPGHRQDFERPPQLLSTGKLGLYMNFTSLHISKYAYVQSLLGKCLQKKGISGYFRPGEQIELWWSPSDLRRENDIIYF